MTTNALDAMFTPLRVGNVTIANRMAMAPMTRQRSLLDGTPTDLNVDYYRQRASAGLIVSEEGRTTEFLLVPYFGACIHVPPPPSNQIVHVRSEIGVKLEELYQPYWIEGQMQVKPSTSELADAGYQMDAEKIYIYELPN